METKYQTIANVPINANNLSRNGIDRNLSSQGHRASMVLNFLPL